jgi:flagellar basal-body rod protein FlgF
MEATSYVALSRQTGLRRQLDVVANNLANMNTSGFKGEKMMFTEYLNKSEGGGRPIFEKIAYVRDIATIRDFSKGPLEITGNPLDFGLASEGFFTVKTDLGDRYTRNGRFQLDQGGQLVNNQGFPVLAEGGEPIFFAPGDANITVSEDGTISTENGALGKLSLITFSNLQNLRPGAGGLFSLNIPNGDETFENITQQVEKPQIKQGMLEGSNVMPIIEMSKMINVHRTYDSVKSLIEREDDRMLQMVRTMAKV